MKRGTKVLVTATGKVFPDFSPGKERWGSGPGPDGTFYLQTQFVQDDGSLQPVCLSPSLTPDSPVVICERDAVVPNSGETSISLLVEYSKIYKNRGNDSDSGAVGFSDDFTVKVRPIF
jgi:hypothetical protein